MINRSVKIRVVAYLGGHKHFHIGHGKQRHAFAQTDGGIVAEQLEDSLAQRGPVAVSEGHEPIQRARIAGVRSHARFVIGGKQASLSGGAHVEHLIADGNANARFLAGGAKTPKGRF